jgi:hypothetical protein
MSGLIRLILFFIWAGVLPVLTGLFPISFVPTHRRRLHLVIVSGYFSSFALFEILGLPVLFFMDGEFRYLVVSYVLLSLVFIVLGVQRIRKTDGIPGFRRRILRTQKGVFLEDRYAFAAWWVYAALLLFQLYMAYTRASFDGDDAYYVVQALQTYQWGNMYSYVPYTGISTVLDGRHAMAMIPMWAAAVSKLSTVHPAIVTHTMLPLIFLPFSHLCIYCALDEMFRIRQFNERRRLLPVSMVLICLLQIFGNVSIYTPETFLLMRTWQGKTVFANIVLPTLFWLLLGIAHHYEKEREDTPKEKKDAAILFAGLSIIHITAGFCTSLAPFMTAMLTGLACLMTAVAYKNPRILRNGILCCIPNMIYAAILLRLMLIIFLSSS